MNSITYLLIEDDETQACVLKKWLHKVAAPCEIEVLIANNLEEGVLISNRVRPATTFLDLHLPLKPGDPVCEDWQIVADAIPSMIPPVIAITGYDITPEMKKYVMTDRGAHNLLRKPFDEGFFAKLRQDTKLFAAKLIEYAGDAAFRSAGEING